MIDPQLEIDLNKKLKDERDTSDKAYAAKLYEDIMKWFIIAIAGVLVSSAMVAIILWVIKIFRGAFHI